MRRKSKAGGRSLKPSTRGAGRLSAQAAFSQEGMHAAHEVNGPFFAHAILTTEELLALLPATQERKHDD
jgi:hypothetical protein